MSPYDDVKVLLSVGAFKAALPVLQDAVAREPQDAEYHRLLCLAFVGLRKPDAAIKEFRILRDLDPDGAAKLQQGLGPFLQLPEEAQPNSPPPTPVAHERQTTD